MSIRIFTDSSANLSKETLNQYQIEVVPLTMTINGEEMLCYSPDEDFDGDAFYKRMREDTQLTVKTSMINSDTLKRAFEPALKNGEDVIYIAMSAGISGTYAAGQCAAEELSEEYPDRRIAAVNTRAASLGEGILVVEAAKLRNEGECFDGIIKYCEEQKVFVREHFLVDDLMFLKRGGRISGGAALAGTILNMKPIMKGDADGCIVLDRKVIGRKKALRTLADIFDSYAFLPHPGTIGIAHGGCEADALLLKEMIEKRHGAQSFMIVCYEPGTGAHVGPGTVALFFRGEERAMETEVVKAIHEKIATEAESIKDALEKKIRAHT